MGANKATGVGGKGSGGGTTTKDKGKGGGGGGHGPNALAFAACSGGKVNCHRCGEEGQCADGCHLTVEMIAKLVKDAKRSKSFPTSAPTPKSVPRGTDGSTSKAKQLKPKGTAKSNAAAVAEPDDSEPDADAEETLFEEMTEKEIEDERDLSIQEALINMAKQLKSQQPDKVTITRKMAHYERKLRANDHM